MLFVVSSLKRTERIIRCASRNFDRKSVTIYGSLAAQCPASSGHHQCEPFRTHPTIHRNIHCCATPSFCKQRFVNGKIASPKSTAGVITASNNISGNTKETRASGRDDFSPLDGSNDRNFALHGF